MAGARGNDVTGHTCIVIVASPRACVRPFDRGRGPNLTKDSKE